MDYEGDMNVIMENVLCATVEDEPRFRTILESAVKKKELPSFKKFTKEKASKKKERQKKVWNLNVLKVISVERSAKKILWSCSISCISPTLLKMLLIHKMIERKVAKSLNPIAVSLLCNTKSLPKFSHWRICDTPPPFIFQKGTFTWTSQQGGGLYTTPRPPEKINFSIPSISRQVKKQQRLKK